MKMDYRSTVRNAIKRAKLELDSGEDHRIRYAALELRMALEGLIYEKASLYKEELSGKKLSTWQPQNLLNLLLEIDPYADESSTLSIGREEEYGKPAKQMTSLGEERVLKLGEIKKFYHRLGAYLHTPTLEQVAKGKGPKPDGMRTKCNEIKDIIEEVLSSPVFNVNFKITASITCEGCETKIVRRIDPKSESFIAKCINCSASYILIPTDGNKYRWKPNVRKVKCANPECLATFHLWESEIKLGTSWECQECKIINTIGLGITFNRPLEVK